MPNTPVVAQMVKTGCVVFVPNGGGQREIVDTTELVYDDIEDAVGKITKVLSGEASIQTSMNGLQERGRLFSTATYCGNIRRIVDEYFTGS